MIPRELRILLDEFMLHDPAGDWCVAGGFAACPAAAADVDVWLYGLRFTQDGDHDLTTRRADLLARIEKALPEWNVKAPIWTEKRWRFNTEENSTQFPAYQGEILIEKVGVLYAPQARFLKPIHIMLTEAGSPGDVIYGFDVSTHAVAVNSDGRIFKSSGYTLPHQPPFMLQENTLTPERMERICQRFGFCYDAVAKVAIRG